jgi:hypothetical protein
VCQKRGLKALEEVKTFFERRLHLIYFVRRQYLSLNWNVLCHGARVEQFGFVLCGTKA